MNTTTRVGRPHKWLWVTLAVIGVLVLAGIINAAKNTGNTHASSTPASTGSAVVVTHPAAPPGPVTMFGDGTYLVGKDIQPGTYKSVGTDLCYWARLSSTDGSTGAIIANNATSGPQVVTIATTDDAFQTEHCGTWKLS